MAFYCIILHAMFRRKNWTSARRLVHYALEGRTFELGLASVLRALAGGALGHSQIDVKDKNVVKYFFFGTFAGMLTVLVGLVWFVSASGGDSWLGDEGVEGNGAAAISIPFLSGREYVSSMKILQKLGDFEGYHSYAVEYNSDGLKLRAVMNIPTSVMPIEGYPVIIMNHGNALAGGSRDYFRDFYSTEQESGAYRKLISSNPLVRYAKEGFAVFQPDYRGHGYSENHGKHDGAVQLDRYGNEVLNSEGQLVLRVMDDDGLRFNGYLYSAYYTIDVLNLVAAMSSFEDWPGGLHLDLGKLFAWGRSLGGDVSARAITSSDKFKAASLWVPSTTSLWDQAHHYHYDSPFYADGYAMETLFVELKTYNDVYGTRLYTRDLIPNNFIDQVKSPVMIQVSIDDTGVRSAWGIEYHYELQEYGVETELRIYPGKDHVFQGDTYEQAVQADLEFFRSHMK